MKNHANSRTTGSMLWSIVIAAASFMVAQAEAALHIADTEALPGGIVIVQVRTDTPTEMAAFQAKVNFDGMLLTCLGVTNASGTAGAPFLLEYESDDRQVTVRMYEANGEAVISGIGTLFQIMFQLNPGAKPGMDATVTLADQSGVDEFGVCALAESWGEGQGGRVWAVFSSVVDSDGDGLSDFDEQMLNGSPDYDHAGGDTDINNPDSDGDGMLDGWEVGNGLNPLANDAALDSDGDGLTNYEEWIAGSSPTNQSDVFSISEAVAGTNAMEAVLHWNSHSGRFYSVYAHTNLSTAWPVAPAYQILGDGTQKSYTNSSSESPRYFRISVELAP